MSGKVIASVVYSKNDSDILKLFIHKTELHPKNQRCISLGGVVVLREHSASCKLVVQCDTVRYPVQWGLPSPKMAVEFPGIAHAAFARFNVDNIETLKDHPAQLLLINPSNETREIARISLSDDSELEIAKQQVLDALNRLRDAIGSYRKAQGKPLFMLEKAAPLLPASALTNTRLYQNREALLESLPLGGFVAEVGTQAGNWAHEIIERKGPTELHLFDLSFKMLRRDVAEHTTVVLHQGDSSKTLAKIENKFFDWIYIDGGHSYQCVKRDIEQAVLKVKPGGLLVFNDYTIWSPVEAIPYGVVAAVNELILAGWNMEAIALTPTGYWDVAVRKNVEK
jgi:Methyltransferase domain